VSNQLLIDDCSVNIALVIQVVQWFVVTSADDGSRPYRSRLRAEQAEQTRLRIAHAARQCFVERGWTGTSVGSVATTAGVSEATVYAVYGTKAELATSLVDSADDDANIARTRGELAAADGEPAMQLAALFRFERRPRRTYSAPGVRNLAGVGPAVRNDT
jgi:AcrR family transcriptional regulator